MSDEKQPDAPKRRLNITLDSFTLFATPRVRTNKKQLRLVFGCSNGYPNVNMDTDEDGEPTLENGFLRLSSRLNGTNFYVFLNAIERAVTQPPGWKYGIECYHTYKNGIQHETKQHVNDLVVGVDNQGLVYVTILEPARTSVKFVFGPTEWHNFKDTDGTSVTQKEANEICAIECARGLRSAMGAVISNDSMDYQNTRAGIPSPSIKPIAGGYQANNNGNGGGGFQKKPWDNGGQGGFQKKPWENRQGGNNQGGYQKKPWENKQGGGYQNNGGQGGYQKKPWENRQGGGNGNGGGFQKKPWDGQNNNSQQRPPENKSPQNDFEDIDL